MKGLVIRPESVNVSKEVSRHLWLSARKLRHALSLLALAESPIALQMLHLDRSYLFFVFSLAWAMALFSFMDPPARATLWGLLVYVVTAALAVPLLLAWLRPETFDPQAAEPLGHALWSFVFGVGVREELCKSAALGLVVLVARVLRVRFSAREGLIYGAMSGLAFAAVENLQALRGLSHLEEVALAHGLPPSFTVSAALSRLALTPLAHACWTAMVGYALTAPLPRKHLRAPVAALALLLASGLHGLYDEAADVGNRLGVGLLLALSFGVTLALLARPAPGEAPLGEKA